MNRKERRAAEAQSGHSDLFSKAIALHQAGRLDEAETICRTLLATDLNNASVIHRLGVIRCQKGKPAEGLWLMETAIKLNPNYADAYNDRGNILGYLERHDEAVESFDKAIAINPKLADAYNNRGVILCELKRYSEAVASFNKAIALKPHYPQAYYYRGVSLRELGQYDEALASFNKAVAINPNYAEAYNIRGNLLSDLNKHNEALASFNNAIAINPYYAEAYYNRGFCLRLLKRYDEAIADYDKAIANNPNLADAYWGKAWAKLVQGEYEEGWALHEWRWKTKHMASEVKAFNRPLWLGQESLAGKTILIHAEQGLGDTIQFCRYIPLVKSLGATVQLGAHEPLHELLSTLPCSFNFITGREQQLDFDFQCPLMSLPLAFKTSVGTVPANIPYLHADTDKRKAWQEKLGNKTRPRVGLVWSGRQTNINDHNRSIALNLLAALLESNVDFYSLQKEVRPDDAMVLANSSIISHTEDLKDFSDTAALIAEMDLIISVDTSVAHLAGALGKPVWILLPFVPDWRWMEEREDSPWYPTARLFRQKQRGDWEGIIEKVKAELTLLK